ncbi:hypothetical protein BGW41_001656 [Actinomortierella wolfii]|nr:hypothetical protein BGW41_001656 [Actinomortierella wolfii]
MNGNALRHEPSKESVPAPDVLTVVVQSPSTETLKEQGAPAQNDSPTTLDPHQSASRSSSKRSSSSSEKNNSSSASSSAETRPSSRTRHHRPPLTRRQDSYSKDTSGGGSMIFSSALSPPSPIPTNHGYSSPNIRQGGGGGGDGQEANNTNSVEESYFFPKDRVHTHKPRRQHSHQQLHRSDSSTRASSPSPTGPPSNRRLGHSSLPIDYITQYSASMTDLQRQQQTSRKFGATLTSLSGAGEDYPPRPSSSASHYRGYRPHYVRPSEDNDGADGENRDRWGSNRRSDDAHRTSGDTCSMESYANQSLAGSTTSVADSYHRSRRGRQPDYGMGVVETHYWPEDDGRARSPQRPKVQHRTHSKTGRGNHSMDSDDSNDDDDLISSLDIQDLEIAHHHQSMGMIPSTVLQKSATPSRPSSPLSHYIVPDQHQSRHSVRKSPPLSSTRTSEIGDEKSNEYSETHFNHSMAQVISHNPTSEKKAIKSHQNQETKKGRNTNNRQHGSPPLQAQDQQTTLSHTVVSDETCSLAESEKSASEHNNYLTPLPPFQQGPAYTRVPRRKRCGWCPRRWWIILVVIAIVIIVVAILAYVLHRIQICVPKDPAKVDPVVYSIDPEAVQGLVLRYNTKTEGTVRIVDSPNATETRVLLKLQRQFFKLKSDVDQQAVTGFQISHLPNEYVQYILDDSANNHRQFFVSTVLCSDSILTIEMPRTKPGQRELALDAKFTFQDVTVQLDESVHRNASWKITGVQNQNLVVQSLSVQSLDVVYSEQNGNALMELQSVTVADSLTAASRGANVSANIGWYSTSSSSYPSGNTSTPATSSPSPIRTISLSSLAGRTNLHLRQWNLTSHFHIQGGTSTELKRHGQPVGSNSTPAALAGTGLTIAPSAFGSMMGTFQPSSVGVGGSGIGSSIVPAQIQVIAGDTATLDLG